MKFLVVLFSAVSVCLATPLANPIENDYLVPAAAPVVLPAPAPAPVTVARVVPFAPSPVRVLSHPAPLPIARAFAPAPFAVPTPLAAAPFGVPAFRAAAPFPVAAPAPIPTPLAAAPVPLAAAPAPVVPVPTSTSSQFHAQDELGGFSFGYANGLSTKQEVRTPDGVTKGGYSYVDANGITQVVEYISDPVNGFRVAGTNIPVVEDAKVVAIAAPVMDTAEVAAAKAEFAAAFEAEVARNAALDAEEAVARKKRSPIENDYLVPAAPPVVTVVPQESVTIPAAPFVEPPTLVQRAFINPQFFNPAPLAHFPRVIATPAAAPLLPHPAPIAAPLLAQPTPLAAALPAPVATIPTPVAALPAPAPIVAPNTQFQAQDEAGGYSFGYQNALSGRQESRNPDGVTRGSYSYVDANGIVQQVQYTADAVNGFQVIGTNLPVAPVA